jgi:hypothetical protein
MVTLVRYKNSAKNILGSMAATHSVLNLLLSDPNLGLVSY